MKRFGGLTKDFKSSLGSELFKMRTVKDVYLSTGTKRNANIGFVLSHEDGRSILAMVVSDVVLKIDTLLSPKKTISSEGLKFFVEYIEENYKRLTLGDIHVWGRECIAGKYGQVYENLTVQKLIIWLDQYVKERAEKIMQARKEKERMIRLKQEKNHTPADPEVALKIIREGIEKTNKKMKEMVVKQKEERREVMGIDEFCEIHEIDDKQAFMSEMVERFELETGNIDVPYSVYEHEYYEFVRAYMKEQNEKLLKKMNEKIEQVEREIANKKNNQQ